MDGEISPAAVERLIEGDGDGDGDETVRVVDIRSPAAFERGHLPGSVNLPFPELADRVDEIADADRVVTVCPHGKASVQAARLVASYEGATDLRVESMAGGLEAWSGELVGGADGDGDGDGASDAPF